MTRDETLAWPAQFVNEKQNTQREDDHSLVFADVATSPAIQKHVTRIFFAFAHFAPILTAFVFVSAVGNVLDLVVLDLVVFATRE